MGANSKIPVTQSSSRTAQQMILRRSFWIALVIALICLPFFVPIHFNPPLSDHNGWNGTSEFRNSLRNDYEIKQILTSPTTLNEDIEPALLLIMGAERAYSVAEIRAIEFFLLRGGSLLICDDFGPGRDVASHFGVGYRSGKLLETLENRYERNPRFPIISLRSDVNSALNTDLEQILLNDASALAISRDELETTSFTAASTFLDEDDDGKFDPFYEDERSYCFFAANWTKRVAVLADASIVSNEMLGLTEYDNYKFVKAVIDKLAGSHKAILIEDSHRNWIPVGAVGYLATVFGWLESIIFSPLVMLALSIAIGGVIGFPLLFRKREKRKKYQPRYFPAIGQPTQHPAPLSLEEEIMVGLISSSETLGMKSFLHLYAEMLLDSLEKTEAYADSAMISPIRELLDSSLRIEEYYTIIFHLFSQIQAVEGAFIEDTKL
ncbi:MAG: DUF4350 domain-containing protein [Candidatus Hodarchaeales archaeon]